MSHVNFDGKLVADYTMLYSDYQKEYAALDLSAFANFKIGETIFSFSDMFNKRNANKEICAETPELFKQIADRRIKEAALIFINKLDAWKANYSKLFAREDISRENSVDDYFWQPTVSAEAGSPQLQSSSKSYYNHHITFGQGVSNADMLRSIYDLESIYYALLTFLDSLFIELY